MNKKIIDRIKNENGYSMHIVVLSLMLVSTLAIFISTQVSRQIKSTTKRVDEIQLQYTSEAGINRTIEEILIEINKLKIQKDSVRNFKSTNLNNIDLIKQQINDISEINGVDNTNLNKAISNINYNDTIEEIILKLSDVRSELLNIVKNNPTKRIQIKEVIDINISKVCNAIDYANLEKNKDIQPIEFKGGTTPRGFQDYQDELNLIIGGQGGLEKYGNTYDDIVRYMADAKAKIDSIHAEGQQNSMNSDLEETKNLVWLGSNMHTIANNGLKNELQQYSAKFGVWNPSEEVQKQILEQTGSMLKGIVSLIDEYINSIRNIRKEIYLSYTYCMGNYTLYKEDEFKLYTDEALKMYDSIEDQLMWFKKKIAMSSSVGDGDNGSNIPENDNSTEIKPNDIKLNGYIGEFNVMNSVYRYIVKYEREDGALVDEITLPIKSQNLKVINLTLVSIATNGSNSYKTRASIEFNIDGAIKYTVNSYKRIN